MISLTGVASFPQKKYVVLVINPIIQNYNFLGGEFNSKSHKAEI
jgi:hypothetical protein